MTMQTNKTDNLTSETSNKTIVVGAGVAGLTVARALTQAGHEVLVLEKSRGLGGRSATRTRHGNRIDHGAQYFTVRAERFQKQVDTWLTMGIAKVWTHNLHKVVGGQVVAPPPGHVGYPRYVFPAGMNGIGKELAHGLEVRRETRVASITQNGSGFKVTTDEAEVIHANRVIVNTPAEQALALCDGLALAEVHTEVHNALEQVSLRPCISVLAGYDPANVPAWQGIRVADNSLGGVSWLAHDSSKRDDANKSEHTVIVLHATPEFSETHYQRYNSDRDSVIADLLQDASHITPWLTEPVWTDSQRWRYALADKPHDARYLQHGELYFCGDWCGGAKVEAAYLSGLALADALKTKPVQAKPA
jgi:predicted NAD/FAD-dependent oxidoreductase